MRSGSNFETNKTKPIDVQVSPLAQPGILVAYSVDTRNCSNGRYSLKLPVVVGRSVPNSPIQICDHTLSQKHFQIRFEDGRCFIDDFNSTNGTFINGIKVNSTGILENGDMIRAGESLFVFTEQIQSFLTPPDDYHGLKGRYYSSVILKQLKDAIKQNRAVLLAGPTGSGKELAANAFAQMKNKPMLTYNAACFSSEEEAVTTLVGVESNVFSGVNARSGLIEQAKGGILFLDEIHNYPQRVQRVLLRILEDGTYVRTGGSKKLKADVSFIFASNAGGPTYMLAEDLLARLRVISLPYLHQRRADIPQLFHYFLSEELKRLGIPPETVISCFQAQHHEILCFENFHADNMRGLIDVSLRIAGYINNGKTPAWAFLQALNDRKETHTGTKPRQELNESNCSFDTDATASVRRSYMLSQPLDTCANTMPQTSTQIGKVSAEDHGCLSKYKDRIWDVYLKKGGNISAVCRALKSMGIETTDKTLKKHIKEWQFPSKKQLKGSS